MGKATEAESKKGPRYYPAEDIKGKLGKKHHNTSKQTKLRSTITPGTVVILLAGHFKGKRAVFLKQLDSGLMLITGPYKINGVPLRRVPQSYVIATQTKVDVSKVTVPDTVNDALFKKPVTKKKKDDELLFNEKDKEAPSMRAARLCKSRSTISLSAMLPSSPCSRLTSHPSSRSRRARSPTRWCSKQLPPHTIRTDNKAG